MTRFKVGDIVKVIDGRNYAITTVGSEGKIVSVCSGNSGYADIEFYKTTGRPMEWGRTIYRINMKDIKLITKEIKQFGIVKFMEGIKCQIIY